MKYNNTKILILNKKIKNKYNIESEIYVGISLLGWEVKSIKKKNIDIKNSYIIIKNKELYLINLIISPDIYSKEKNILYNKCREKKILLKKKEILNIYGKIKNNKNINIFLISIILNNNKIKLNIGIGTKKKIIDKSKKYKYNIKNYIY